MEDMKKESSVGELENVPEASGSHGSCVQGSGLSSNNEIHCNTTDMEENVTSHENYLCKCDEKEREGDIIKSNNRLHDDVLKLEFCENKLSHAEETLKKVSVISEGIQHDVEYLKSELNNGDIESLERSVEAVLTMQEEEENLSNFDRLPQEIIKQILSYLTQSVLCHKVSRVCRRWYNYARDPVLWKTLNFTSAPNITSFVLCRTIKRCPYLRTLILRDRTELTLAEVSVLTKYCPLLQEVDLGFCFNLSKPMLDCFVSDCKNLERINLEGCKLITDDCIRILTKAKHLKHLNFSHCSITDDSINYLAENLEKIVSLNCDGISWITDRAITSVILLHSDNIESLELDGAELTDWTIETLTECRNLKTLSISFCELLSDMSLTLLQKMQFNKKPGCLKLRKGMEFSPLALHDLFLSPNFTNLHTLELSECTRLLDDGVAQMAKCCGSSLHTLALSWCWNITDVGLISIMDHCGNLVSLDLVGIDKIKGECLDRIPEDMTRLVYLDLRQCNKIIDDLIVDVIRRKPDLKVLNYYGEEFIYNVDKSDDYIPEEYLQ